MSHFLKEEQKSMLFKTQWSGHFSQLRIQCAAEAYSEILNSFLREMIHRFWTLKGLHDYKMLGCQSANEIVLLWSFLEEGDYNRMKSSAVWKSFQQQLNQLIASGQIRWVNSISNTYEIVE